MTGVHHVMADVGAVMVDAGAPGDDPVGAAVDGVDRNEDRTRFPSGDIRLDLVEVIALLEVHGRRGGVLRAADDRRAEGDHPVDRLRSLTGDLTHQEAAEAPPHQPHRPTR